MTPLRHALTSRHRNTGFTLLELLLSMALLSIVMIIIAAAVSTMQNTWVRLREKSDEYRGSRMALDGMTRHLQQATLATRWVPDIESTVPNKHFKRASNLHFVCGAARDLLDISQTSGHSVFFQGPFGEPQNDVRTSGTTSIPAHDQLNNTLCAWGYFVEFGSDVRERPAFMRESQDRLPPRRRFRLLEFRQPTDELNLFALDYTKNPPSPKLDDLAARSSLYQWFREPLQFGDQRARHVSVLAENVLACLITPFDPALGEGTQFNLTTNGEYDSRRGQYEQIPEASDYTRHKLPPALRLTVIMMSEDSWRRLTDGEVESTASELQTAVNVRFRDPSLFEQDLNALEGELNRIKMRYRIFTTNLRMPEQ